MAEANQLERQLWRPMVGWQVLRRLERYQRAVDRFVDAAKAAEGEDGPSLFAFEFVSLPDDDFDPQHGKIRTQRAIDAEAGGVPKSNVRRSDEGIEYVLLGTDGDDSPRLDLVTKTKYCREFAKEFGFVLRYPIRYDEPNPNEAFLEMLWAMHPAAEYSTHDLFQLKDQSQDKNRFESFNVTIDWYQKDTEIKKCIDGLIKETLSKRSQSSFIDFKYQVSDDFNESQKIWDFRQKHLELSWPNFAEELNKVDSNGRTFDTVRNRVISFDDLLKKFEKAAAHHVNNSL